MKKVLAFQLSLVIICTMCSCAHKDRDLSLSLGNQGDESQTNSNSSAFKENSGNENSFEYSLSGDDSKMANNESNNNSDIFPQTGSNPALMSSLINSSVNPSSDSSLNAKPIETASVSQNFNKSIEYNITNGKITYNFGEIYLSSNSTGMKDSSGSTMSNNGNSLITETNRNVIRQKTAAGQIDTVLSKNSDGSASITQKANSLQGISSIFYTLAVSMDYDIIAPVWGGVRLTRENPDFYYGKNYRFNYPNDWQAQMLLIQGKEGGLLVCSNDNASQFKSLTITHDSNNFYITIETVPQAPFDKYSSFQTKEWKIIPYKSEWTEGAKIYKSQTTETFNISNLYNQKAKWASKIQFVILDDLDDLNLIKAYTQEVIPGQTMILVPGWRKDSYDVNYPDYTPKDGIKEKIKYAQSLGFKVAVHCNMIGADMSNPDYIKNLTGAHSLNSFSKQPIIESYTAFGKNFAFAQINPASSAWRSLLVSKIRQIVSDLGVDAIHLDQSLLCFNDGRGLVEGMTSMQGSIKLLKELTDALPGIAFSGEGLTEIDMQYISFLQMHVYGVDSSTKSYSNTAIGQICPLSTAIFGEYVSLYHYPALPVVAQTSYYDAWYRAGERAGLLPTIMRESSGSMTNPSKMMETVLNQALWKQQNLPKINIINPWAKGTVFKYTLKNGSSFLVN